jgi:hypothetical protein
MPRHNEEFGPATVQVVSSEFRKYRCGSISYGRLTTDSASKTKSVVYAQDPTGLGEAAADNPDSGRPAILPQLY